MIMRSGRAGGQVCIDKHREDNGCSITAQPGQRQHVPDQRISSCADSLIWKYGHLGI